VRARSFRLLRRSLVILVATLALSRNLFLHRGIRLRKLVQRRWPFRRFSSRVDGSAADPSVLAEPGPLESGSRAGLRERWRARHSRYGPIRLATYRGYGTTERLYLKGRVLEDEGIAPVTDDDSVWRNLINTYKRFESDEIPGARVVARFQGAEHEVVADEEGYFELWIEPESPLPADRLWHEIELEVVDPLPPDEKPARATGYALVPPPSARFGIISDVDDTVVLTNATSMLKMARTVMLGNARTRLPFEGVAAFYQALQGGEKGREFNPLFYVSSSPWNLYEPLTEFLEIQDIPLGPLLLRDWGFSNDEVLPTRHAPHKFKAIRQVLNTFPSLPFILIGDSGQEDPEIYSEIVHEFPNRILAIYIRNVSRKAGRAQAILTLAQDVTEVGSTLVLTEDTLAAAKHAARRGWVSPDVLPEVAARAVAEGGVTAGAAEEEDAIVIEAGAGDDRKASGD
jgi:phosphatidate phosphatase APP1